MLAPSIPPCSVHVGLPIAPSEACGKATSHLLFVCEGHRAGLISLAAALMARRHLTDATATVSC